MRLGGRGLVRDYRFLSGHGAPPPGRRAGKDHRGRVEIGGFHTIPFRLRVEVRNITIHGREAAGEVPYIHVDRLVARIKVRSALGIGLGFESLVLERPQVHVILYPNGTSNQPEPQVKTSHGSSVATLVSLSIGHLEVRHGALLWNDQKLPLEGAADDVSAELNYSLLPALQYDGNLLIGKINTTFDGYRPVAWMTEAHFTLSHDHLEVQSLKATSGRSNLQANARLSNFRNPEIAGEYDLTLDLGEAGAVSRHGEVHSGMLQVSGKGSWSPSQFASAGKLLVKDLDWHSESLNFHADSVSTQYSLDPQRLALSGINAKVLGGEVSGDVEVSNLIPPATISKNRAQRVAAEERGSVRLRAKNLSARDRRGLVLNRPAVARHEPGRVRQRHDRNAMAKFAAKCGNRDHAGSGALSPGRSRAIAGERTWPCDLSECSRGIGSVRV